MAKSKKPVKQPIKPLTPPNVYDPNLNYQWKPEDTFVLDGQQFSKLYADLRTLVSTTTGVSPSALVQDFDILHTLLVQGITSGKVFPIPPQQSNN